MQAFSTKIQRLKKAYKQRIQRWRKHPLGLPVAVFLGLVLLIVSKQSVATFHPDTSYIAIISHDGVKQTVPTREPNVGALLKKLGIQVAARDRVEPSLNTAIVQDNFHINVYRATPVTI